MKSELENLLGQIEERLGWGDSADWQGKDFENLNQKILDATGVSLSESTLKRLWGKVEYNHLPSLTTLDTLAKFAGYDNWRYFQQLKVPGKSIGGTAVQVEPVPSHSKKSGTGVLAFVVGIIIFGTISLLAYKKSPKAVQPAHYSFSSEPVTHDIPNSVIFKYDASGAPSDSIFIQQSWDMRKRVSVNKNEHIYTSIYYEPGFYKAKLFVDSQLVKEHPLMVPTNNWLAMIDNKPVPVYLKTEEFVQADKLSLPESVFQNKNIAMQPNAPTLKYYNVGNFQPVPVSGFSFSSQIKNDFSSGSAACQFSYTFLITDDAPILIPLAAKGCISELYLRAVDSMVSGKKEDLSGFGADFTEWVNISAKSLNGKIVFIVNDKEVYSCPLPSKAVNIVGLGFYFQGTGSVKNIRLYNNDKLNFQAF
jgi:hypothetical protein